MLKQTLTKNNNNKSGNRLPFSILITYGFGGIIPIALFNIAGQLMGLIGNISMGLSAFWLGVIMIIPRLWDALSDPIVGHLSDHTRSRWGRRRPYLFVGGIAVAISFVVMWWIPDGNRVHLWFHTESGFQWFQLLYILFWLMVFFTACTIFEIPHGALGMELTNDYHERTRLFSAKSFIGNLFAMSTPWLFALANMEVFRGTGNEADGMRYVSMIIPVILIPLSFWWFFKLREPGYKETSKQEKTPFWKDMKHTIKNKTFMRLVLTIFILSMGFNFVNLLAYYIQIFYLFRGDKTAASSILGVSGTVWAITGLIAVFPLNWLSPAFGKRKTLFIAIALMILAQLLKICCYNPNHPYLIVIPFILLSTGMLFFFTLGSSMVGDVCDEDELKTGRRSEGSYYSVYWWFIKMGTALASFVAGLLIVFTQFDEIQVTKGDDFQGSIKELQIKISDWNKDLSSTGTNLFDITQLKINDAIKESEEYLKYLEVEAQKEAGKKNRISQMLIDQKKELIFDAASEIKLNSNKLEHLKSELSNTDPLTLTPDSKVIVDAIPITLKQTIEKARIEAFDLMSYFETKLQYTTKSKQHYTRLLEEITQINQSINTISPPYSFDSYETILSTIEKKITVLKLQSPYTLLTMRVVEIGLPILLSIISVFFAYSYPLTEERCYEIKELLEHKNLPINGGVAE